MIHNANMNVLDTEELSNLALETVSESPGIYELELSSTGHVFFVGTPSISHLAVMNEKTARVLHELSQIESCRFRVYLSADIYASIFVKDVKSEKKIVLQVDIVIYGAHTSKWSVGCLFADSKIYLQHPCYQDVDTPYDNPHVLVITDLLASSSLSSPALSRTRTPVSEFEELMMTTNTDTDDSIRSQDLLQRQVGKVFGSLTRFKSLKRLEADIRVTTKLLPHQEEALDFMAQREFGPVPEQFSLWMTAKKSEQTYYENKITGKKEQNRPEETFGGILADDMGLGKTLTVLSTIIRTASSAKEYAEIDRDGCELPSSRIQNVPQIPSRATLVVVPSPILIDGWKREVAAHCDGSLNIHVHHGRDRAVEHAALADYDIVLTTYHTIAAEALDPHPPLNRIKWFRIVLDEAHIIRRMSTKLHQAVSMLSSKFRWCLTGTPIQNSLEDLAALIAFMRCSPLDSMIEFRKHIISPVMGMETHGVENIRNLLDSVCLRRTKELLNLPETTYEDRRIDFSLAENAYYSATQTERIATIKKSDSQGRRSKDFFRMFQLHLQLRRICNHGTFHKASSQAGEDGEFEPGQAFEVLRKKRLARCEYCRTKIVGLEDLGNEENVGKFSTCGHLFCTKCYPKYDESLQTISGARLQCSICSRNTSSRSAILKGDSEASSTSYQTPRLHFAEGGISSKVAALMHDIKNKSSEGKSIVFSCWTRSLDLVAHHLSLQNIDFARIDGSYSLSQRQKILDEYEKDDHTRILLMTTGTGAVGLNLTVANCVYILEPQWNPMVEKQAIARVLRLGQHRDVKVVRYFVNQTYEVVCSIFTCDRPR
ncbi:uncharacterized protein LY89DRAFT_351881 [Mollisia scopiformis]|uniref:Uncharacterized protein n=1 Tax=Mollisia scopiformis TaxID=149040 RepID=A0A132B5P0_MOLSC|nr:uncharacterized protein LY89DRAFT_351881 [Mollisia scopiformis]KUJ07728.1 hypothetical protein LY89DRAFT_351881 [Mollisia scopiformis]